MRTKRVFDIFLSLIGLIFFFPIILVISLMIIFLDKRPVLFSQKRTGRFGKEFDIYKFRTMIIEHDGDPISIKGQNRITNIGKTLRKYKLDEIPELWNILIGDMSFVGPRPDLPEYTCKLTGDEIIILHLRPGLTGPATLKYKNEEEILSKVDNPKYFNDTIIWPDKVKINVDYFYNRSLLFDLSILVKTIFSKW